MKFMGDSNDVHIMTLWGIPAGGACYLITKDVVFAAIFTVIAMHIIYVFYKHKVLKNSLSREKEMRDRLRENYTTEELSSLDIDEELR